MHITCWGSRGSTPVSGKEFVKYGGDTTCIEIRTKSDDIIIVDAGTGIRRLGNHLVEEKRFNCNMIFTHAHWDHLIGFPAFKPLFMDKTRLTVYRCPFPGEYIENMLATVMKPPNFPVRYSDLRAEIRYVDSCPAAFQIGSVTVESIALNHPDSGCGYKFTEDGHSFVFLTDNELDYDHPGSLSRDTYMDFCKGADLLFHDAEYTPKEYVTKKGWGHSLYTDVIDLAMEADVKNLGLFHINSERTDVDMDLIVDKCQEIISKNSSSLHCFATGCNTTFTV
ncbi:MAG: MBL fold metallo-hydrolase [Proteobacteria bacterium]|nr:MBL fold metallo-hydrolase [Pseudomonadota bacterium]